jgi:hypothetical protein
MLGFVMMVLVSFSFIFFVARGCVASQESTEIRKYITGSDSTLSDSANLGSTRLQPMLVEAGGDPANLDAEALQTIAREQRELYQQARTNEDIPPEFTEAHPYLVSALGIRATAIQRLSDAAGGNAERFQEALAASVEDFIVSDRIIEDHFIPASERVLGQLGRESDQSYLYEPAALMDYEALGVPEEPQLASSSVPDNPNALHGVEILEVQVAGQPLFAGGNVVLSGSDEPIFSVGVKNGGEVPEADIPVEVVINTQTERQAQQTSIPRLEAQDTTTVQVGGFRPGQLNETAEVTVEVGPVKYEDYLENNTLTGTITFGV